MSTFTEKRKEKFKKIEQNLIELEQKWNEFVDEAEKDARSWKMKFEILEASMRRIMSLVQDVDFYVNEGGRDVQKEIEHALLSCGVGDKCE